MIWESWIWLACCLMLTIACLFYVFYLPGKLYLVT